MDDDGDGEDDDGVSTEVQAAALLSVCVAGSRGQVRGYLLWVCDSLVAVVSKEAEGTFLSYTQQQRRRAGPFVLLGISAAAARPAIL